MLVETIRNLYFHVPMWFAMITMRAIAYIYYILRVKYLSSRTITNLTE